MMMLNIKIYCVLLLLPNIASALSIETHMAINERSGNIQTPNGFSLNRYLIESLGTDGGVEAPILNSTTNVNQKVSFWLRDGGAFEDDPPGYTIPYRRSRNHFHNPLLPLDQAGYTSWGSFCDVGHCPASAILWALGPQNSDTALGFELNPGGDWSWSQTRQNYYRAVTTAAQADRDTNFANTFRGLGHFMHLVQDMAIPADTRNDAHPLDAILETSAHGYFV